MLGVLDCDEVEDATRQRSSWYYSVNPNINAQAIRVPDLLPRIHRDTEKDITPVHISGTRIGLQA
jgi:hypothetical protein